MGIDKSKLDLSRLSTEREKEAKRKEAELAKLLDLKTKPEEKTKEINYDELLKL